MNRIQSYQRRGLRIGVVVAVALSLTTFTPAGNARHSSLEVSLGVDGSANAVEHRLLGRLQGDLGVDGSSNAVERRLISHLADARDSSRSANAQEHQLVR
jgi:hypothetical protein